MEGTGLGDSPGIPLMTPACTTEPAGRSTTAVLESEEEISLVVAGTGAAPLDAAAVEE